MAEKTTKECGSLAAAAMVGGVISGIANAPKAVQVVQKIIDKIEGK